jgi:4'-phosphopantetheinyl transferase EntD
MVLEVDSSNLDFVVLQNMQIRLEGWIHTGEYGPVGLCGALASLDHFLEHWDALPTPEKALVQHAVPSRQAEFATGRWCARAALAQLGARAEVLGKGALGEPLWPTGYLGSITHESGLCLALAASKSPRGLLAGLGLDLLDTRRPVRMTEMATLILHPLEQALISNQPDPDAYLQLLFAAKEAVVKAVSARVGRYLDLTQIHVSLIADVFTATLEGYDFTLEGRWCKHEGFILCLAILKA